MTVYKIIFLNKLKNPWKRYIGQDLGTTFWLKKINQGSLSVLMQTCSQCALEFEQQETVSSLQTEETRTTIFRQLIRIQRKVVMLVTVNSQFYYPTFNNGQKWPALAPTRANKFWTDKTKTCSNSSLTFPCVASGAFAFISLSLVFGHRDWDSKVSVSLSHTHTHTLVAYKFYLSIYLSSCFINFL